MSLQRLLLVVILIIIGMHSKVRADKPTQVFQDLFRQYQAEDSAGFTTLTSQHAPLLPNVMQLVIRHYINSYDDSVKSAQYADFAEALAVGAESDNKCAAFAREVISTWERAQIETYRRANTLRRIGNRENTAGWTDSLLLSVKHFTELGAHFEVRSTEISLADKYLATNQFDSALVHTHRAIAISESLDDYYWLCHSYLLAARAYENNPSEKIRVLENALALITKYNFDDMLYYGYLPLACAYYYLNDYRSAAERFRFVDSLCLSHDWPSLRLYPLRHYGLCHQKLGNIQAADSTFGIALELAIKQELPADKAWIYCYRSDIALNAGDTIDVRSHLEQAREVFSSHDTYNYQGVALACYQLGRLDNIAGRYRPAIKYLIIADSLYANDRDRIYPLKEMGLAYQHLREPDTAFYYYSLAEEMLEKLRIMLGPAVMRRYYLIDKYDIVSGLIQILFSQSRFAESFRIAENFRSRSLFELLQTRMARNASTHLANRVSDLEARLNKAMNDIRQCHSRPDNRRRSLAEVYACLDSLNDINMLDTSLRLETSPQDQMDVSAFQALIKPGEIGLYYFVYKNDLYVWYTDGDFFAGDNLSRQYGNNIDQITRFYQELSHRPVTATAREDLQTNLGNMNFLIPEAVRNRLETSTKLVIYASGPLSYFPFEALQLNGQYLTQILPLVYYPSVAIHSYLQGMQTSLDSLTTMTFVGDAFDSSVAACDRDSMDLPKAYLHSSPLQGVLNERTLLQRLFKPHFTDFFNAESPERIIKDTDWESTDILHISTHGVICERNPEFTALVFSSNDQSPEDEVLMQDEISRLQLDIPLVVLSACQTGLGQYLTGEGLWGLTNSFMIAGTKSLVVSLWPLDENASVIFIKHFYRAVLEGNSTADALSQARKYMIENTPYTHPYYWAPLIAIGDWK